MMNSFIIAAWRRAAKCAKPLALSVCICTVMLCVSVTLSPQAGGRQDAMHESVPATVHAVVPEESFVSEQKKSQAAQAAKVGVYNIPASKTDKCKETYNFLPCSDSLGGSAFLVIVFGAILMYAAQCIGDGGEALLELDIMPPAMIGGLLLPLLGAIPDAVIILVSGLGGTKAEAQHKIAVGVGTLAGSTIMILCIAFASSLFVARCDIDEEGQAKDEILNGEYYDAKVMGYFGQTKGFCSQLFKTGITYDSKILRIKRMMLISSLGFLGVQIPSMIWKDAAKVHTACLAMAIFCFVCLVVYLVDNMITEAHTEHHEEANKLRLASRRSSRMTDIMQSYKHMIHNTGHEILDPETGSISHQGVSDLFDTFDVDNSGYLDTRETEQFTKMIVKFTGKSLPTNFSSQLSKAIERNRAELIAKQEAKGSLALCKPKKNREDNCINKEAFVSLMVELLQQQIDVAKKEVQVEEDQALVEAAEEPPMTFMAALRLIVLGTGLVTVFSDAMVDSISSFGKQTGISNFTMGFVVCPYISNASELLSSLQLASHKKKKTASVAFAQIYAAVIMNNCICNGVFFMLVWLRGLEWTYAVEVFGVVFIIWVVSLVTCGQTTIRMWLGVVACILYPLALGTVEISHAYGID